MAWPSSMAQPSRIEYNKGHHQQGDSVGTSIDPVRGMRDVLPSEYAAQAHVAAQLDAVLAGYGYHALDLPIIEQRDLYLRKLGEELVGKVYEFAFSGRELALRPEWTASVLRSYVGRMQDRPLPLRLRYAGPVFRNERPQRATYRQFTQVGVELIGGLSPRADAECIALAAEGLRAAGVASQRIRIGHIGLIRALLAGLGLAERTQGLLAWSLEKMREQGVAAVRSQLDVDRPVPVDRTLIEGLHGGQAEALLLHAMREIGVNLRFGSRPPEEIVGRLVRKLQREDPQPRIERALALLERLCHIQGPPHQSLPAAEALLREYDLPADGLAELHAILELVRAHGVPDDALVLDFGLGRGLHYYTGLIFEIYDDEGLQICGGGRYDDLVATLGGRNPTPAVGFAYGLERVVAAARTTGDERPKTKEVLVVAADDATYPYALQVAAELRARGYTVGVDVRGRTVQGNLRDAVRRDVDFVALVGPTECEEGVLVWRDVAERSERRLALAAIA
jgi:histidyl-tRNA synthetase